MALPEFTQGKLDGLCGVYAFVNGYIHRIGQQRALIDGSLGGDLSKDLFQWALETIPGKRYPGVLWDALSVDQLFRLCRKVCKRIETEYNCKHEVVRPFREKQFRTARTFFDALVPYHSHAPPSFVILGLDQPGHWVALREFLGTNKVRLLNGGPNIREDTDFSLRNGEENRICQQDTIVVRLTHLDGAPIL